jgi:hypothetical protein
LVNENLTIGGGGTNENGFGKGRLNFQSFACVYYVFCMRWLIFDPKDMQSGERC